MADEFRPPLTLSRQMRESLKGAAEAALRHIV